MKELDATSEVSLSAFRFRRDTSMRAEMLDDGLIELTEEPPLNDDGAVSGVKVVGIEGTGTGAVANNWLAGIGRGLNGISVSLAASAVSTGVDGIPIVPALPSPSPLPSPLLPLSLLP